ncbi:hypothetical protein [Solibacillus isronensis]|uniref:hypothetical protein n=1 Tax=Solibacillus isronensis TaxID=412383 RepID=UPI0007FB477B|nr:hypothetical protein [Solibacillus silvestris]OBW54710.1 hypothetical protein A9986_13895 [Solibacillus silvestris]
MKKKLLIMLIGMVMVLAACSEEKVIKGGGDDMKEEVTNVSGNINKISVTGYDSTFFTMDEEERQERKVVFEKEEEIEQFLKAIKDSSVPSGEITSEGENFRIELSYKDGNADTILLWLYPARNLGRIQKENTNDQVRILSEEDVLSIAKLLEKKFNES